MHQTRTRIAGVVLVAALAVVLAACDVPAQPAGDLYNAWVANNHAAAAAVATPAAVTEMFSQPYAASTGWFFDRCEGAAGSTFCTWIDKIEGRLQLQVQNSSQKVINVTRISLGSIAAGRLFHAWRIGDSNAGAPYATPSALFALFAKPYFASDHWTPEGCDGAAGSLFCTWHNDANKTIILQVRNVEPPRVVINVSGTFHP
jgi:hypothetical protein